MTTTSNIRTMVMPYLVAVSAALLGYVYGHNSMKHECASIMTAGVPVPAVPVIYLSEGR